ncbi:hypothetical protein ACHAW5_009042 [Stephanodiscus triporus]|uniref:Peptidase A2 domain-containing protein n=1 Tax=Stephanodiscus triporus TaxID=2934178 RepID=A0ABD3MLA0_9STRA
MIDRVATLSEGGFPEELVEDEGEDESSIIKPLPGTVRVPVQHRHQPGEAAHATSSDRQSHNHVHHPHQHHSKKTPVSAYVDTGAQVTVISVASRRGGDIPPHRTQVRRSSHGGSGTAGSWDAYPHGTSTSSG